MIRSKVIAVRVNKDEERKLAEKAEKLGVTISTFLRMAAMKYELKGVK